MSSPIPSRKPAWNGTGPAAADFAHAPNGAALAAELLSRFTVAGRLVGRLAAGSGPLGHFLAETAEGAAVLHVKHLAGGRDLSVAAEVADHLAVGGVAVTRYRRGMDGAIEQLAHGLSATLTSFVPARHARASSTDAAAVGRTLAATHAALRDFPHVDVVRQRGGAVVAHLAELRQRVRRDGVPSVVPATAVSLVAAAAELGDPAFSAFGAPQCLHGDLSPGNVLFALADGAAWLTDFEDAAFAWRPVAFDLGMAVLRFAVEGDMGEDGSTPIKRVAALIGAYDGALELEAGLCAADAVIHNTVLLLTDLALGPTPPVAGEWAKPAAWRAALESCR